ASPRKPRVRIWERSSSLSFEVAWRSTARTRSSRSMPLPSSVTRIRLKPPPWATTSMRLAPASIAFSTSSLTTLAGRSTTSPAAMRLMRFGGSWRMAIQGARGVSRAQIAARDDFTRFYRRLVERVDAQEMAGEDRFQHEMHHQGAKRPLVEPFEVDGAHRPAGREQGLGDRLLLRGHEIAGGVPREVLGVGDLGEIGRDARPAAGAILAHHCDEVLRRAVEIELKLAVLIDRTKCRDRRRPLALLAEALAPELHVPGGEARKPIAIGQHHAHLDAAFLGEADGDGGADRRREVQRRTRPEQRAYDGPCAVAQRLHVEAAGKRRQEADIGQRRKPAADVGVVRKRGDRQGFAQVAQAVGGFAARLSEAKEQRGDAGIETSGTHRLDGGDGLHQSLRRVARLGDDHETGGAEVEARKRAIERAGIEIVVEAGARAVALPAIAVVAGNAPTAELGERLAAQA